MIELEIIPHEGGRYGVWYYPDGVPQSKHLLCVCPSDIEAWRAMERIKKLVEAIEIACKFEHIASNYITAWAKDIIENGKCGKSEHREPVINEGGE